MRSTNSWLASKLLLHLSRFACISIRILHQCEACQVRHGNTSMLLDATLDWNDHHWHCFLPKDAHLRA